MDEIPKIYTLAQRKMLPLRQRIMDAIYETGDQEDITVAEVVGLLETIKFEILMTEGGFITD